MNKSKNDVSFLIEEVATFQLEDSILTSHKDEAILYYIAGYIARSLMKSTVCQDCHEVVSPGKVDVQPVFEEDTVNQEDLDAKAQFVSSFSREGLVKPADSIHIASLHAFALFQYIIQREQIKQVLLQSLNPQSTFVDVFVKIIGNNENTSPLLSTKCRIGHIRESDIAKVAKTVFNIGSKNFSMELNDVVHNSRKRHSNVNPKTSVSSKKQKKLMLMGRI